MFGCTSGFDLIRVGACVENRIGAYRERFQRYNDHCADTFALPVSKDSTRLKIVVRTGEDQRTARVNGGRSA